MHLPTTRLLEYTIPPILVTENPDGHNSETKRAAGDEGRSGRTGRNAQSRPEAPLIRSRGRDFWYLIISVRSSLHNRSRVTGSQLIGGSRLYFLLRAATRLLSIDLAYCSMTPAQTLALTTACCKGLQVTLVGTKLVTN